MGFQTRSSRFVVREILLVGIAAAAAFVFVNHGNLYLSHPFRLSDVRIESYFLATAMVYLFLRLVIVALELRPPREHGEVALPGVRTMARRPECRGPGGPSPDRAHTEAVAEGDRLGGRPP